jgi:hypothetical protein
MLDILQRLEDVLRKYAFFGQANVIAHIANSRRSSAEAEFREAATGIGMWGGAGSVWDAAIAANARVVTPDVRDDERKFRADIIAFAEALEQESLGTPRSREIAAIFRDWNARAI